MKKFLIFILPLIAVLFAFADNEAIKPDGNGTVESPYLLTKIENLVWMEENIAECQSNVFRLENDIDASEMKDWQDRVFEIGSGKNSLDGKEYAFSGVFDGNNYAINNLSSRGAALFHALAGAKISNLKLNNISIGRLFRFDGSKISQDSGALTVSSVDSLITNVHVTGVVYGIGGVVGKIRNSRVVNCSFLGILKSHFLDFAGGIVGEVESTYPSEYVSYIEYCKASGYMECFGDLGLGERYVGGICGCDGDIAYIRYCYADMKIKEIQGQGYIGGICGTPPQNIDDVDGLKVTNSFGISQCYSTCSVDASLNSVIGGIVPGEFEDCVCFDSYYDRDTMSGPSEGIGVTSDELKKSTTFQGWDFANIWSIRENESTPYWHFLPEKTYEVCLIANPFGKLTLEPSKNYYQHGESLTVTANPLDASKTTFVEFKKDLSGSETSVSITMTKDLVIVGDFAKFLSEPEELKKIGIDQDYPLNGHYIQVNDFDMENATLEYPIGSNTSSSDPYFLTTPFRGIYDGQNHYIKNLQPTQQNSFLFGMILQAQVKNLQLLSSSSETRSFQLIVNSYFSQIINCYVNANCGFWISQAPSLCVSVSYSEVTECGLSCTGYHAFNGMIGATTYSEVNKCFVEYYNLSQPSEYSSDVGLTPSVISSTFANCYAKGTFRYPFTKTSAQYEGKVFSNCYAFVYNMVGMCRLGTGEFFNCYANSNYVEKIEGVTGFVSEEDLKKQATFAGWDFENIWGIEEGVGTPYFKYTLPEPAGLFALLSLLLLGLRRQK